MPPLHKEDEAMGLGPQRAAGDLLQLPAQIRRREAHLGIEIPGKKPTVVFEAVAWSRRADPCAEISFGDDV